MKMLSVKNLLSSLILLASFSVLA
ncbi:MAG: hypothetical protein RLZZ379_982, partial [Pseudomonadota bacterium]